MSMRIWDPVVRLNARQRERASAISQHTRERFVVETTDNGVFWLRGASRINFGYPFLEEPVLSVGAVARNLAYGETVPLYSAMVYTWVKSGGLWIAALVAIKVEGGKTGIQLGVTLTFEAEAIWRQPT